MPSGIPPATGFLCIEFCLHLAGKVFVRLHLHACRPVAARLCCLSSGWLSDRQGSILPTARCLCQQSRL